MSANVAKRCKSCKATLVETGLMGWLLVPPMMFYMLLMGRIDPSISIILLGALLIVGIPKLLLLRFVPFKVREYSN